MKPYIWLLAVLLAGCATPPSSAPRSIVVTEDLRFTWRPPIGFPERITTISAGTYSYRTTDFQGHIFFSPEGKVSIAKDGDEVQTRPGGIGIDKYHGEFYVWYADVTVEVLLPIGPAVFYGEGGRPLYQYIGKVPKHLLEKIKIRYEDEAAEPGATDNPDNAQ